MIMSILMRATPAEVRFIMVDPKRVEFAPYEGIPHLYVPVVTECREASSALSWAVAEMERRLKMFSKCGVRNIITFNEKARAAQAADEAAEKRGEEPPENLYGEPIPYIVIVIDELADLMMNVGKEVEFSISRIAQLARAAGIHLIIATQRPSTNVVTGLIKANITCRIGLTVASGIDSRVILDSTGAENLIGMGDMLSGQAGVPQAHPHPGPLHPRRRDRRRGGAPEEPGRAGVPLRDPEDQRRDLGRLLAFGRGGLRGRRSASVGGRRCGGFKRFGLHERTFSVA